MKPDDIYNALGVELKYFEDQVAQLKRKQPNGNDTVNTYANVSAAVAAGGWDIDQTLTWSGGAGTSRALNKGILFTADEQDAPVSNMRYEILLNNTYWYTIGSFDAPFMGLAAVNGYVHDSFLSYLDMVPEPKKDGWYFNLTSYVSGTNLKVRFIVDSTDTGTITVMDV